MLQSIALTSEHKDLRVMDQAVYDWHGDIVTDEELSGGCNRARRLLREIIDLSYTGFRLLSE